MYYLLNSDSSVVLFQFNSQLDTQHGKRNKRDNDSQRNGLDRTGQSQRNKFSRGKIWNTIEFSYDEISILRELL